MRYWNNPIIIGERKVLRKLLKHISFEYQQFIREKETGENALIFEAPARHSQQLLANASLHVPSSSFAAHHDGLAAHKFETMHRSPQRNGKAACRHKHRVQCKGRLSQF